MLVKSYIEKSLIDLDKLYNERKNQRAVTYYSKLAVIELSGWIEESIDDIFKRIARRKLREIKNYNDFDVRIKSITGFTYESHIKKILIDLIGLKGVELFEKEYNKKGNLDVLKGMLTNLKGHRDPFAHTFIRSHVTAMFQSPSTTLNQYKRLRPLVEDIEKTLLNII